MSPRRQKATDIALLLAVIFLAAFLLSSAISITFEQAGIILAFVFWSVALVLGFRPGYRKGMLDLAFLLLLVSQIISSLFSSRPSESFWNLRDIFFVSIVYLFATLTRSERTMKVFVHLFLLSAAAMSIYGLGQRVIGVARPTATQSTPLTYSGILTIALCVGLSFAVFGASRRERLYVVPQLLLIFAALVFSYSRSSWIAVFAGVLFMGIVRSRKLILGLILVSAIAYFAVPGSVRSRAASIFDPHEPSNNMRIILLRHSPEVIKEHPVTGLGLIDLLPVYDKYVYPHVPEHLRHFRLGHFHNNLVQVTVQTGILGLTIFLFLVSNIVRSEWGGYRAAGDRFLKSISLGNLAAFLGFFVNGMFDYNFGDSEVIMLLWFTLGLSLACRRFATCK